MKSSAKLIVFSQETKKDSDRYPVKIRISKPDNKYEYIGLKFYLTGSEKKRFVNKKGEILPSYKDYDKIITQFNIELKKVGIDDPYNITQPIIYRTNSFSQYLEKYIENLKINSQIGLTQKTNTLKYQLELFCLESSKKPDITFYDLNIDFLNDFKNHLTNKNVKPISQRGYFEKLRVILNKAIKENKYNPSRNPFFGFEFKKVNTEPKHIKPQEFLLLKSLVDGTSLILSTNKKPSKLSAPNRITGLKWLFQYYSFGMRVSDLLLLQWKNVYESGKRIQYTMFKTKTKMDVVLNNELLDILFSFLSLKIREEIVKKSVDKEGTYTYNFGGVFMKVNKKTEWYGLIRHYLYLQSTDPETKNKRIFSKIPDNLDPISDVKKVYSKVATYTSVYNKKLKNLSNEIEFVSNIQLNLSSHMARHTFAYISLLEGKDVYYISKALNHKSIKTTEIYLKGFPIRELDGMFYKEEIKIEEKKAIDDKLKEIIANANYEKKKKMIDLFS